MTHELTRSELYELVWAEPMTKLAKRFGISDVGLAKACRRADIPVPNRGYWAKVHSGKKTHRLPLPPAKDHQSERIVIEPFEPTPPPALELPAEIQQALEDEKRPERQIHVPKTLNNAHPIIEAWLDSDRRFVAESRVGGPNLRSLQRHTSTIEKRRLRILTALFKALEKRGFKLLTEHGSIYSVFAQKGDERIEFGLSERQRQRRVMLTKEEMRDPFVLASGRRWKQVREATGELVFRIRSFLGRGAQSEWCDAADRPLETRLNAVVSGFIVASEILRKRRLEELDERHRQDELMHKRWEEERAREEEQKRVEELIAEVSAWRQAAEIRAYVAAVRAASRSNKPGVNNEDLERWISWALSQADRIDRLPARAHVGALV